MTKGEQLVLQTLAYSSCFRFALTVDEVWQRLPFDKQYLASQKKINDVLKKLLNQGKIKSRQNFYFLDEDDWRNRVQRQKYVQGKQRELAQLLPLLRRIPTLKAVILTGSTAVDNAKQADDLDFMVICQAGTLWLTRLLVTLLTKFKHKRPLKKDNNAWCFNIYLDERDLTIPRDRRSLYEAYEILQMRYVLDTDQLEQRFLAANSWLKQYLSYYRRLKFSRSQLFPQAHLLMMVLNHVLFFTQVFYRRLKFGHELFTLTSTQAFFNETRYRETIFARMEEKMKKIAS